MAIEARGILLQLGTPSIEVSQGIRDHLSVPVLVKIGGGCVTEQQRGKQYGEHESSLREEVVEEFSTVDKTRWRYKGRGSRVMGALNGAQARGQVTNKLDR